ncbi:MAG TPA: hypothetical protein VE401_05415 [Solirubrobacterales bacterium]|jgi:hypothetical protein|nr:hypothetical protein [Solirubrobacterales bacterium]
MIPAASGYFSLFLVASILAIVAPEWPSPDWLIFLPLAAASLGAGFFLCRWNAVWLVLLIPAAFATTDVLWVANVIEPPVGWYYGWSGFLVLSPFLVPPAAVLIATGILIRNRGRRGSSRDFASGVAAQSI